MQVVTISAPAAWERPLQDWGRWLRAAGRPSSTLYIRDYQVRRVAAAHPDIGPWEMTTTILVEWLSAREWKPATRRAYRSALRSFYDWAHAAGYVDHNPAAALPSVRPEHYLPRPTPLDFVELALEGAGERERLMVMLAVKAGLRRGEIAKVHSDDLLRDLTGWSLRVVGKGGRVRMVPLVDELARALRAQPVGYVFPGPTQGHLSAPYVGKLVSRLMPVGWTTHTLRHRFGTNAYQKRRDLLVVQQLLGHASVATTQVYVAPPLDALRQAVEDANEWARWEGPRGGAA